MAGIYIHIPFCKQRCTYCDFYTEVAPLLIPGLINALCLELEIRSEYVKEQEIDTIYFGGGTPSLLSGKQFQQIFDKIFSIHKVSKNAEITFEANPDDINQSFLTSIAPLPFNRISMGVQSFDDAELKSINRRHSGQQAKEAVQLAQEAGFSNISIDLIYGLPNQNMESWTKQLDTALSLQIQHISVYGLSYEKGTKLWKQREEGKIKTLSETTMLEMYHELLDKSKQCDFEAYEISNFAKSGFRSQHNSAYWKLTPYLGIGPSAHSYNGNSRQWNIASTKEYMKAIAEKTVFSEKEELSINDQYNDYIMISLRTREGANLSYIEKNYGKQLRDYCLKNTEKQIELGNLIHTQNNIALSTKGIDISNLIIRELIYI